MSEKESVLKDYAGRSDAELMAAIRAIKAREGDRLTILGHHYQIRPVVEVSDFVGDSFKLCRDAADARAKHIVFCGVRFMAESARVLARPDQVVQHPDPTAGCPMADMANLEQVEEAWQALHAVQPGRKRVPVTYMNSNVDLKAFCGRHGGVVCTSSNAEKVLNWAYSQGDRVLFFPDEHLGRNTAHQMGMAPEDVAVWDRLGGAKQAENPALAQAKLVVWKGFCHVHTYFTVEHIRAARAQYPGAFVMVHPECPREVVAASDAAGSTEAIVRRVREAQAGETVCVGTELNLVSRLAQEYPGVRVVPLAPSVCPNMSKITLAKLLWTLEHLGETDVVEVEDAVAGQAREALGRMLELAG
jgi:quinolinate synthase